MPLDNFIAMDEPRHSIQRKTVAPSVAPSNLMKLEPLIRERVIDIVDKLPVGETFNWVEEVSVELTARMLAVLFDFPYEDRHKLVYWSDITTASPQLMGDSGITAEVRQRDLQDCANTFAQLWIERGNARTGQRSDFDAGARRIDARHDVAAEGIPRQHPAADRRRQRHDAQYDQRRRARAERIARINTRSCARTSQLIPNMVAEMVRWQTSVIHMRRTALRDTELNGKRIREGEKVIMWYLSGNRDEAVFENRRQTDHRSSRTRAAHVSFGFGVHRCMGNRLAEMQLRVLWEEIMKRFHTIEVVGDVKRHPNNFIRGIAELPVRIRRA